MKSTGMLLLFFCSLGILYSSLFLFDNLVMQRASYYSQTPSPSFKSSGSATRASCTYPPICFRSFLSPSPPSLPQAPSWQKWRLITKLSSTISGRLR